MSLLCYALCMYAVTELISYEYGDAKTPSNASRYAHANVRVLTLSPKKFHIIYDHMLVSEALSWLASLRMPVLLKWWRRYRCGRRHRTCAEWISDECFPARPALALPGAALQDQLSC